MGRVTLIIVAGIVIIHGLIHLMGFVAYWPLGEIAELPYKTTLLGDRWDVGKVGMRFFSTLWLAAAIGLIGAAVGTVTGQTWWFPMMGTVVLLSLIVCVLDWQNAFRGAIVSFVILIPLLLVWGLRIQPSSFAAYPQPTQSLTAVPLPSDLPAPVTRYYQTIISEEVPVIETAVITARGSLRFANITFPARLRFTHKAGQGYRHYIEATIFDYPLLKVDERYLDGQSLMELPVGIIENEPKINMAANLGLWGESIWLPTIFITDPRVRWQAVDDSSAQLIVPFEDGEDIFTVVFDVQTGLIQSMEAMRYREADDAEKIPWRLEPVAWETYNGILIPSRSTVTWVDEGIPWLVVNIDDVSYNVDVDDYIRAKGP